MKSSRLNLGLLVAIALTGGISAHAQPGREAGQDESQQEDPKRAEVLTFEEIVVVTASKVQTEILDSPASVSVVTSDVIETSPAQNYGELMRAVPGINVAQTSNRDINLVTRGATSTLATSQLALLDGRSIYQDFFGFILWDVLPIDTREISQIEVIRGPASAVWGPNAMTGVVNVISKTPRELDGTSVVLRFGGVDRDAPGNDLGTGTSYHASVTHARAVNDRLAYKISAGVFGMDALARPTGRIPVDPERGTGGGLYPPFPNSGTTQPKFDARVDYDFANGREKLIFAGGIAGTQGIIHTGIGPFDIQSGTVFGYGKVNYQRDNLRLNFFANVLDGTAPALLAVGPDGRPIDFLFKNNTYDAELGNSHVIGTRHVLSYGGNFRYNSFDLSIAPLGDNRTEGGFYIQDEIFLSDHFRWVLGGRVDGFSVLDKFVFSPRMSFIVKPTADHALRFSYNRAFRAPSFVNSFLDVSIVQSIDLSRIDPRLAGQQYFFPIESVGNPDLNEETMTAFEVGYTGTVADRFTLSAAWYWNLTSDNIVFTQVDTYDSAAPPPGWPLDPRLLDLLNQIGRGLPSNFGYRNLEGVTDRGLELGVQARLSLDVNVFANYSWQAEPVPDNEADLPEFNIPATNRFNAGIRLSRGRFFADLSVNYTSDAFWANVLDARFHGTTDPYTMVNGGLGVRWADELISTSIRFTNLNNADAQQHIFGDIIKRQVFGELAISF